MYTMPGISWAEGSCFGDGQGWICPCGNLAGAGEGCANSSGVGAVLRVEGTNSVGIDNLKLVATQIPALKPALAFASSVQPGMETSTPLGDGLRCTSGASISLGVSFANLQGIATWSNGLGSQGNWGAGDLRDFQVWYRDPVMGPCAAGSNTTNVMEVLFRP